MMPLWQSGLRQSGLGVPREGVQGRQVGGCAFVSHLHLAAPPSCTRTVLFASRLSGPRGSDLRTSSWVQHCWLHSCLTAVADDP